MDALFQFFNTSVLLPWLLMAFAPNWRLTRWLADTRAFVLFLSLAYAVLLVYVLANPQPNAPGLDFISLDGILAMFSQRETVLVGWIHYLAFDLLAGTWLFRHAQERAVPAYWRIPCLFLTLMFGPLGFGLYHLPFALGAWRKP